MTFRTPKTPASESAAKALARRRVTLPGIRPVPPPGEGAATDEYIMQIIHAYGVLRTADGYVWCNRPFATFEALVAAIDDAAANPDPATMAGSA